MSADNVDAISEAIVGTEPNDAWPDIERVFRAHYARLAQVIARVIRDPARAEELLIFRDFLGVIDQVQGKAEAAAHFDILSERLGL